MAELQMLPQWGGFLEDYRFKVAVSGRGAGKSVAAILAILYFASRTKIKVLCLREFQTSIDQSVKAQIEELIAASGTEDAWIINKQWLKHKVTGSLIIFRGMNIGPQALKSIPGVDIAFIEEAEDITADSWQILVPTIRKPTSEIWLCFNKKSRTSIVAQTFLECDQTPPGTIVMESSYLDNPYLSEQQVREAEHMRKTNPKLYAHVWLGEYLEDASQTMVYNVVISDDVPCYDHDAVVMGCDIAEEGGDRTVFIARKGRKIIGVQVYDTMTQDDLPREIMRYAKQWNPEIINIDATGFGHYAPGMLALAGVEVNGINFAAGADNSDAYSNKRTELYGLCVDYFNGGGTIPRNHADIALELEAVTYTLDDKRRFKLLPKKLVKKRLGKSCDLADAFALSMYNPRGMFAMRQDLRNAEHELQLAGMQLMKASKWKR